MNYWVDIDGILADFDTHFLRYLNLTGGHATSWHDPRFVDNFHKIVNKDDFWLGIPPLFNPALYDFNPVGYCTSRSCSDETTRFWLRMCLFPEAQIVNVGHNNPKGPVLRELGCELFIDDSLDNYHNINACGVECWLMTRSHNKSTHVTKRVDHISKFLDIANERTLSPLDLHS